jgi:hypothetical protein
VVLDATQMTVLESDRTFPSETRRRPLPTRSPAWSRAPADRSPAACSAPQIKPAVARHACLIILYSEGERQLAEPLASLAEENVYDRPAPLFYHEEVCAHGDQRTA